VFVLKGRGTDNTKAKYRPCLERDVIIVPAADKPCLSAVEKSLQLNMHYARTSQDGVPYQNSPSYVHTVFQLKAKPFVCVGCHVCLAMNIIVQ
jgi:hypothetical protein